MTNYKAPVPAEVLDFHNCSRYPRYKKA